MKNKKADILNILLNVFIILAVAAISIFFTIYFGIIFKYEFGIPIIIEIIISILLLLCRIFKKQLIKLVDTIFKKGYLYSKTYDDKKIRLSFAYLIRIKVNNRYLLVRSNSRKNLFQPVGGVYHIDKPNEIKKQTGFYRDDSPGDANDIRGIIKGNKIKKFIKWFNKNIDRESGPYREFKEEMIDTGILPNNLFNEGNLKFSYCDSYYKGVYHDEHYNIKTLLRFDIYELILDKDQLKFIHSLKNRNIKFATYTEIETLGVTKEHDERQFGTQTPYILEDYREKENTNE